MCLSQLLENQVSFFLKINERGKQVIVEGGFLGMLLLLIGVMLLCLYRIEPQLSGFNGDYLSKGSTSSIKGIFILLIVISHSVGGRAPVPHLHLYEAADDRPGQ